MIVTQRVPPAHTEPSDSTKPSPSNAKGGSTRPSLVFPRAPHNPPLPPPPRARPRQCAANHSPRMLTRCASVPSMPLRRAIQRAAIKALSAPDAAHHTHHPTPFFPAPLRHNPVSPLRSPLPSGRPLLCLGSLECRRPPYHGRAVSQWHPRRRPRVYCGGYVSRRATLASATDAAHLASITDTAPSGPVDRAGTNRLK